MKLLTEIFSCLVDEIHTSVIATIDENNLPVTCAVDIMDYDDEGVYFLTSKGKGLYKRLSNNNNISLTAMKGNSRLETISITIKGTVKELGSEKIGYLFSKNEYMNKIYPTEKSRLNLTVFKLYKGNGEFFDLSVRPIKRIEFSFGGEKKEKKGYFVTDKCINCGRCKEVCPQNCIVEDKKNWHQVKINHESCLNCGNCAQVCPVEAILKRI